MDSKVHPLLLGDNVVLDFSVVLQEGKGVFGGVPDAPGRRDMKV